MRRIQGLTPSLVPAHILEQRVALQIGGYDGSHVAQKIQLKCSKSLPRLVALSSDPDQVDAAQAESLFAHALKKPLVVQDLLEAIGSL